MKRILFSLVTALFTLFVTAQEKVVIRTYNDSIIKFNIWDVKQIQFIIEEDTLSYSTPDIVDLGLSVCWGSFNLGADDVNESGKLFGWGALYESLHSKLPIFYPSATPPEIISASSYDIAKAKLGGLWRMPTTEEIQELIDSCDWEWSVDPAGWIVKRNDNKIFLPVTYYRNGDDINTTTLTGNYWSGSLAETGTNANQLYFSETDSCTIKPNSRWLGFAIRPVFGEYVPAAKLSLEAIDVTFSSLTAKIRIEGALDNVEESGLLYGTNASLDINSASKLLVESIREENFLTLNALSLLTTYYIKAYIKVNGEYIYSDEISVKTKAQYPVADMVDLGLSVKWASWNMGAECPSDSGGYYHWNDPYNIGSHPEFIGYTNISGTEYDMAHIQWKDQWRMPTEKEWNELYENCEWTYQYNYEGSGVNGMLATSNITGNSIFFPYSGKIHFSGELMHSGVNCIYWTSNSIITETVQSPYGVKFKVGLFSMYNEDVRNKLSIRPVYGPLNSDSTEPEEPTEPSDPTDSKIPNAVDLGLSVKWASWNVGASSEEDYGKYFFWGDRDTTRTDFDTDRQFPDLGMFIEGTEYDVAHNMYGGAWRLPTQAELDELVGLCEWTWTTKNGVNGYVITGTNGASIFLPASGKYYLNKLQNVGYEGCYWSSELYSLKPEFAWYLMFDYSDYINIGTEYRDVGFCIRAVQTK